MLKLNLFVYDETGSRVDGLCVENAAPQMIQAVLMFLKPDWSFEVRCEKTDVKPTSKN